MDLQRVKSSNIEAVGHEGEMLVVRFRGGATYEYEAVPAAVADELLRSKSVGSAFDRLVRKASYKYRKVPPEEAKGHAIIVEPEPS